MWRNLTKLSSLAIKPPKGLLPLENPLIQQTRNTFVLKRRYAPFLHKKNGPRKKLKPKHYIYDLEKDLEVQTPPKIEVILTSYVEGLGNVGEKVTVLSPRAYEELLLPGLAVYATPENVEKYKDFIAGSDVVQYSSKNIVYIMNMLANLDLAVTMNKDMPWVIQPWHIRVNFRKCGFEVPEDAIELPPNREIKGPNLDIENKDFYVTVTINNKEKVKVRCKLHHWSTNITERLPWKENYWKEFSVIFPEDEEIIKDIISKRKKKIKKSPS